MGDLAVAPPIFTDSQWPGLVQALQGSALDVMTTAVVCQLQPPPHPHLHRDRPTRGSPSIGAAIAGSDVPLPPLIRRTPRTAGLSWHHSSKCR